ncbi:MAG: hypothetical protein ACYDA9_02310 [Terriglobia bacterium]
MTKHTWVPITGIFICVMTTARSSADMRAKVESHYSLAGAPSGIANTGANVHTYYVQGSARRDDVWSGLGSHSAVIRHCDSGKGYYVDFLRKQYWELRGETHHSKPAFGHRGGERAGVSGQPSNLPTVTVQSRTVEIGKPRVLFGRLARHYVTTAKQFVGAPTGSPQAEETIDGWYWPDLRELSGGCIREDLASQPSAWIGEPDLVVGATPVFEHTGPSSLGLSVEETRTVHTKATRSQNGGERTTTLEHKVVEFSDSPLDPNLFMVPKGFRKVPHPKFAASR